MAKKTVYETEMIVPAAPIEGSLDFITDRVRELATPVIVCRFYFEDIGSGAGMEAATRLNDINNELASRGLSQFPPLTKRRREE